MQKGFAAFFLSIEGSSNNFWHARHWTDIWKLLLEPSRDKGGRERKRKKQVEMQSKGDICGWFWVF